MVELKEKRETCHIQCNQPSQDRIQDVVFREIKCPWWLFKDVATKVAGICAAGVCVDTNGCLVKRLSARQARYILFMGFDLRF